jgi:hypothetical protein
MEGDIFQNSIRTMIPNAWLTGENSRKKFPGLTVLKYCLVIEMEFGMSDPQDFASIKDE